MSVRALATGVCVMLVAIGAASCTNSTRDGVIARNDLVSLILDSSTGVDELRLVPASGVKINAKLKPSIERVAQSPLEFDAEGRTADSVYFVSPPTVRSKQLRPIAGTLRASACPEGKRVCLSVELPVSLR